MAATATCAVCEIHAESTFRVEGLDCHEEVALIERRFKHLDGLESFTADVVAGRIRVQHDAARLSTSAIVGAVADVRPFLEGANVLAVPLEAGGGTRLKILEAFAAGLPVVSTPVGAEGIAAEHGKHLVIAPRTEFGTAIAGLLERPAAGLALAHEAKRLAELVYDWSGVGRHAADAIEELF